MIRQRGSRRPAVVSIYEVRSEGWGG